MPPRLSKTTLLGFRSPAVNGDEVILPVVVHAGHDLHGLSATPRLWREIIAALQVALQPSLASEIIARPPAVRSLSAKSQAYEKAWQDLVTDLTRPVDQVAAEHGLNPDGFTSWIHAHYPRRLTELRRALGISLAPRAKPHLSGYRAPVTKPGGKIL